MQNKLIGAFPLVYLVLRRVVSHQSSYLVIEDGNLMTLCRALTTTGNRTMWEQAPLGKSSKTKNVPCITRYFYLI